MALSLRCALLFIIFVTAFSFAVSAQTTVATDPSRIGVGARSLGMGKSFIGLSDDVSGMFITPASLYSIKNFQATTMSGRFINEFDYMNLAAAAPTKFGNLGLGTASSNISFVGFTSTTEVLDGTRIIPSTTEGATYGFNNRVYLLSWSTGLGGLLEKISLGASYKFFTVDLSGPGIVGGRAKGNEFDFGLNFKPSASVSTGLVVQNALPAAWGGKIRYENGNEETFPSILKVGLSLKLLGEDGFRKIGTNELSFNLDEDLYPLRPSLPSLTHTGFEWSPLPVIDLRLGIDQETVGTGSGSQLEASNNLTAGVGLYFGEFRFDYAYHQYSQLSENTTNYFSITYGAARKKMKPGPSPVKTASFKLLPADKSIMYGDLVTIEGRVLNKEIKSVKVNSLEAVLANDQFKIEFPLVLGKNFYRIDGYDGRENNLDSQRIRILRLKDFKDVPPGYWSGIPIGALAMENIFTGYPDGTFKPEGNISRAELCLLLVKTMSLTAGNEHKIPFKDVAAGHWAARSIAQAVDLGIVKGYPDGRFRPNGLISRAEGVAILSRFDGLPAAKGESSRFTDVSGRSWAYKDVAAADEAGWLDYLKGDLFEPDKKLTRSEVAEMLARITPFSLVVADILDWEKETIRQFYFPEALKPAAIGIEAGKPEEIKPEAIKAAKMEIVKAAEVEKKEMRKFEMPSFSTRPMDKTIVYNSIVTFEGQVINPKITRIRINNVKVVLSGKRYKVSLPLKPGKNSFSIIGYNAQDRLVGRQKIRILSLKDFSDVVPGHPAKMRIALVATLGIMNGFADGTFKPGLAIRRADYLIKLLSIGKIPAAESLELPFIDIKPTDQAAPYIKAGYQRKIITGYPDRTFRPKRPTSRAESVVMLIRFTRQELPRVKSKPYPDAPVGHWAVREITAAKQTGMLKYVLVNFYPDQAITRANTAVMLSNLKPIKDRIKFLLDWGNGYD
ncbi:MAG: S-layer homology domain-containing protein [Candidatus Margulisbacteria bacterium]|nr:S-layer homology domain-containing protein [Candidatus Margulisiibacteriota bacterium]